MKNQTLQDFLVNAIHDFLDESDTSYGSDEITKGTRSGSPYNPEKASQQGAPPAQSMSPQAIAIAQDLVNQTLRSGVGLTASDINYKKMSGGNTAEYVGQLHLTLPFVLKMDSKSKKLADEGEAIRQIRNDNRLSHRYRDAWPSVYAIRSQPPYAYLMEFFRKEDNWISLEQILYPTGGNGAVSPNYVLRLTNSVLDILFEGYRDSANRRLQPSVAEDYVIRIRERLEEAAAADEKFISRELIINGRTLKPWQEYIRILSENAQSVSELTPPFTTVVHGDPNPGNILLNVSPSEVNIKLIDPKDWVVGDYLFDICKITHFLEATGPVENGLINTSQPLTVDYDSSTGSLNYTIGYPVWTRQVVDACRERVDSFARHMNDRNWVKRYELGMAANILGLPIGRLRNNRDKSALVLYGEGLKWLDDFCSHLQK